MKNLMDWHFNVQKGMYFDRMEQINDCSLYLSEIISDGYWNYCFVPEYVNFTAHLESILEAFHAAERNPCLYFSEDKKVSSASESLIEHGFTPLFEESFMTYSIKKSVDVKPSSVVAKQVKDDVSQHDFLEVFGRAYGGEKTLEQPYGELDETYVKALSRSFKNQNQFFHYVCYEGQFPVSIASLCFVDGKGGLYNVGTLPAHRGKGYGTIATKACVDKWLELDGETMFLQTETGSAVEKWYQKMGFKQEFIGRTFYKE